MSLIHCSSHRYCAFHLPELLPFQRLPNIWSTHVQSKRSTLQDRYRSATIVDCWSQWTSTSLPFISLSFTDTRFRQSYSTVPLSLSVVSTLSNFLFDLQKVVKSMVISRACSAITNFSIAGINVTLTETDRFETLSLYYDVGDLTIIITHNVRLTYAHLRLEGRIRILIVLTETRSPSPFQHQQLASAIEHRRFVWTVQGSDLQCTIERRSLVARAKIFLSIWCDCTDLWYLHW